MEGNPFKGVNPYLNSLLQTPGTNDEPGLWGAFHSAHIGHIADALNEQLPPNYTAQSEQSLQVRAVEWGETITLKRPRLDVTVFQKSQSQPLRSPVAVSSPVWEASMSEVIEPSQRPNAVIIREGISPGRLGRVVTRIELLSPSNKPGGNDFRAYVDRRIEALEEKVPLVEVDYLHESVTLTHGFPVYPYEEGSYPFTITVNDPRPSWQEGRVKVYGSRVNEPLPIVPIPLAEQETLLFNFDPVYQYTFKARRYETYIDYQHDPLRFQTYSLDDQVQIRERVQEININ